MSASGQPLHPVQPHEITPRIKPGDGRWKFGYLQGGAYLNYQMYLAAVVRGLQTLGWIEPGEIPTWPADGGARDLWNWLSERGLESPYIEFVGDAFWSADWDREKRKETQTRVIHRLNQVGDLDLMLAAGTWAGQDLANDRHSTPTFVISTTDAVRAGIVSGIEGVGLPHVHAKVAPDQYRIQIEMFHDLIAFDRLGVAFEPSPAGRTYAAMDDVEAVAAERGFEVITCPTIDHTSDPTEAFESVRRCYTELAPKVDALFITYQSGVTLDNLPELLAPLIRHNVPTFSQAGPPEVQRGALLSLARNEFRPDGLFFAKAIAACLNGAVPVSLNMVYQAPPTVAINLETARAIGYDPPLDILAAADEIFLKSDEGD